MEFALVLGIVLFGMGIAISLLVPPISRAVVPKGRDSLSPEEQRHKMVRGTILFFWVLLTAIYVGALLAR